jgi:hypothetical protein
MPVRLAGPFGRGDVGNGGRERRRETRGDERGKGKIDEADDGEHRAGLDQPLPPDGLRLSSLPVQLVERRRVEHHVVVRDAKVEDSMRDLQAADRR